MAVGNDSRPSSDKLAQKNTLQKIRKFRFWINVFIGIVWIWFEVLTGATQKNISQQNGKEKKNCINGKKSLLYTNIVWAKDLTGYKYLSV